MEQRSIIGAWDDFPIHQSVSPIEKAATPDALFLDQNWFVTWNSEQEIFVDWGIISLPNAGVMVANVCAYRKGIQYNLRAQRPIDNDRADMVVGPFSFTVVEPLKQWRIAVVESPLVPVACDVRWEALVPPTTATHVTSGLGDRKVATKEILEEGDSHLNWQQPLTFSGSVTIDGQEYALEKWLGARDRNWGVTGLYLDQGFHVWASAFFDGFCLDFWHAESREGAILLSHGEVKGRDGTIEPIDIVDHEITVDPVTRELISATIRYLDSCGLHEVSVTHETPGTLWRGAWSQDDLARDWLLRHRGRLHLEGEQWDMNDPDVRAGLAQWNRHKIGRFVCDGALGEGVFEFSLSRKHRHGAQIGAPARV